VEFARRRVQADCTARLLAAERFDPMRPQYSTCRISAGFSRGGEFSNLPGPSLRRSDAPPAMSDVEDSARRNDVLDWQVGKLAATGRADNAL